MQYLCFKCNNTTTEIHLAHLKRRKDFEEFQQDEKPENYLAPARTIW